MEEEIAEEPGKDVDVERESSGGFHELEEADRAEL